jgi:hypothetical protein
MRMGGALPLQDTRATSLHSDSVSNRGLYIEKYPPPPGGEYQPMSFRGKYMKSGREKEGKCKRKRNKGEEKGRKRKKGERIR